MSAAGYAGLSASLSGVRAVELVIAPQATRELSGLTIAIAVARGVANLLPPRWDPLFRRRLRSFVKLGVIEAGPAPTQPTRPTKIELVLSQLPTHLPAAVVPVDLDQAGSRLFLQRARAPTIPHFTATLDHGALVIAPDADRDARFARAGERPRLRSSQSVAKALRLISRSAQRSTRYAQSVAAPALLLARLWLTQRSRSL
jgi:hypothetical protein